VKEQDTVTATRELPSFSSQLYLSKLLNVVINYISLLPPSRVQSSWTLCIQQPSANYDCSAWWQSCNLRKG